MKKPIKKDCSIPGCGRVKHGHGLCNFHLRRKYRGADLYTPSQNAEPIVRLMRVVKKGCGENGDCWEVTSHRSIEGYGSIKIDKKTIKAHRFSWEYHNNKKIPEGLSVLHSCDNPPCVNPDHLSVGTTKENSRHMVDRNRINVPKGEDSRMSLLTNEAALFIYKSDLKNSELAKLFNVHRSTIRKIKQGKTWQHITQPEE